MAIWDTQPPQPTITTSGGGKFLTTDQTKIPLLVDFGERVLQLNPLKLVKVTGFARCAPGAGGPERVSRPGAPMPARTRLAAAGNGAHSPGRTLAAAPGWAGLG